MRKIILLLAVFPVFFSSCSNEKEGTYPTLPMKTVEEMMNNYKNLITSDPSQVILQITMDDEFLREFLKGSDRLKLIAAAYTVPQGDFRTTIIIQLMKKKGSKEEYTYYDFRSIFKPTGKLGSEDDFGSICPPPADCGIPVSSQ